MQISILNMFQIKSGVQFQINSSQKYVNDTLWVETAWMSILLIWSFCLQPKVNVLYQGLTFDFDPKEAHYLSYTQNWSHEKECFI